MTETYKIIQKIHDIIVQVMECPEDFDTNKCRIREKYSLPRQIKMYAIRKTFLKCSTEDITKYCGVINHSTILHGIRTIDNLIDTDSSIREQVTIIMNKVKDIIPSNKISMLDMAINVVEDFLKYGKISGRHDNFYCLDIDFYLWNNDIIINELINCYRKRQISIKYELISEHPYLLFHINNFELWERHRK